MEPVSIHHDAGIEVDRCTRVDEQDKATVADDWKGRGTILGPKKGGINSEIGGEIGGDLLC